MQWIPKLNIKYEKDAVVVKGKIWRSLDLAHQSNSLNNPNYHPTSVTTASNGIHNSLINANQTPHYQRHDFKNRRSSSEPANEQKMLAHIQANSTTSSTQNYNIINQNTTTAISNINSHSSSNNNQTNSTSTSNSLVTDDENPSDDFIDCLHQKTIPKVSKFSHHKYLFYLNYSNLDGILHQKSFLSFSLSLSCYVSVSILLD